MKENIDIENLLERFHRGLSSAEENLLLLRLLEKDTAQLDVLAQSVWEQHPLEDEAGQKAEVLKALHRKLQFNEEKEVAPSKTARVLRLMLRYAAIFIVAFGVAWLLIARQPVQPPTMAAEFYKVTVAYGSKSTIELPDGSMVTLNSGSTLRYPGTFSSTNRTVILDGEAFFDVKKNPAKPFLVKTKDITVKVLGTTFNVKSYPDEDLTETTLVTGRVEIIKNQENNKSTVENPLVLAPNEKAVFYRESNKFSVKEAGKAPEESVAKEPLKLNVLVEKEIKTEPEISWKNNILVFNSEPFSDIIIKLERWYNVEVTLKYTKLSPVVFSGKFDKESIQEVLHALSLIEPFKYKVNKNQILIYK